MSEEPAMVEVTVGPYKGQRLTMSKAEAQQAVADKWAVDPFTNAKPREEPKEAKPPTEEERAEILAKAEAAMAKLRGEEPPPKAEPVSQQPPKAEPVHTRDMAPETPKPYRTK